MTQILRTPGRLAALAVALTLLAIGAAARAAPPDGYWSRAAGTWVGEAGYLDAELSPIVKRYGAALDIRVDGGTVVQTEWKYYPASPLATQMTAAASKESLAPGEGLEQIGLLRGTPDESGAIEFGPEAGGFVPAGAASSVGTVETAAGVRYRHFYTFPSPDRMGRATFGFAADGSLKGVAVFQFRRVPPAALEAERAALRERFGVAVVIDRTHGAPVASRVTPALRASGALPSSHP